MVLWLLSRQSMIRLLRSEPAKDWSSAILLLAVFLPMNLDRQ